MGNIERQLANDRSPAARRSPALRACWPARRCCTRSSTRGRSRTHRRTPGLNEMLTAFDFEPVMFANVPQAVYDYTAHGDGGEWNLRRNRQAFDWVDLLPGKAVDPASVDLSSQLLGLKLKYPIMIAPTATQVALHPDGEAGMYRAAHAVGEHADVPQQQLEPVGRAGGERRAGTVVVAVLSAAGHGREPGAARARARRGLHGDGHHRRSAGVVLRAEPARSQSRRPTGGAGRGGRAGGAAAARRAEPVARTIRKRLARRRSVAARRCQARRRGGGHAAARRGAASCTASAADASGTRWEYLDQVRKFIKTPIIIKGIVTAEDARLCVERGFDGIVVSNHGGRSMDYGPSTLEVLPEIVAAVNGKIPVMIDSGFRRGSDVLKALALGADAVWLGRASRWALGAFGPLGVQRLLTEIIFKELVDAAAAAGKTTLASIDASIIKQNWP